MAHATTTELLERARVREVGYRWDLTNMAGDTVIGQLRPSRRNPPVITNDAGGRLGRQLRSLVLPPGEAADINPTRDAVRPWLILQNGTEWPLGVFRWAGLPRQLRSWGPVHDTRLIDRTTILDQETTRVWSFKAGTQITTALRKVIGEVLPADQYVITSSAAILYAPMSFPIGSSRLNIISELVDKLAYLPGHFDHGGIYRVRPIPDVNTAAPDVTYLPGTRVVAGSVDGYDTLLDTPNEYMVYESSGNGTGIKGFYRVPDTAPHSRANRGFPVPLTKAVDGLSTYQQAELMAAALAMVDGRAYEFRTFAAPVDPRHDQWSVVRFEDTQWLEPSWQLVCSPTGLMDHELRQVYTESWVPS